MAKPQVFACPSCGASLHVEGDASTLKCQFCGNTVVVPEDLRRKAPAPAPGPAPIRIEVTSMAPPPMVTMQSPVRASRLGCWVTVIVLALSLGLTGVILFATLGGTALAFIPFLDDLGIGSAIPGLGGPGTVVLSFGGEGTGAGLFTDPRTVTVDGEGRIYAADFEGGRVQVFDSAGKFVTQWQPEAADKIYLTDLAV